MKKIILIGFAAIALAAPIQAEPARPVIEAAIQASPAQRLIALEFFRSAYPGMREDLRSQLKAQYPNLEHNFVDAFLKTWAEHPGVEVALFQKVQTRFEPRIKTLRTQIKTELAASYPNFESRLFKTVKEHSPRAKRRAFLRESYPEVAQAAKEQIQETFPNTQSWYPGKFFKARISGQHPFLDRLQGIVAKDPGFLHRFATQMVTKIRRMSPSLASEWGARQMDARVEFANAMETEFPGMKNKIVTVIEMNDRDLPTEVLSFLRTETQQMRADMRKNLEAEMPGFENFLITTVKTRYPDLQDQLLAILK